MRTLRFADEKLRRSALVSGLARVNWWCWRSSRTADSKCKRADRLGYREEKRRCRDTHLVFGLLTCKLITITIIRGAHLFEELREDPEFRRRKVEEQRFGLGVGEGDLVVLEEQPDCRLQVQQGRQAGIQKREGKRRWSTYTPILWTGNM